MSGRTARAIRKKAEQSARRRDREILPDLKAYLNALSLIKRLTICWRLINRRF